MIEKGAFLSGLHVLGLAFNRQINPEVTRVFDGVLSAKLSDAQWEQAVKRCLEAERFFPAPATLLRYGLADATPPETLAGEAYQAILRRYEAGERLHFAQIKEQISRAAADAFMAAGGFRAFEWCEPDNEPFRWKAFKEAFLEDVEAEPALALPAGKDVMAIEERSTLDRVLARITEG